MTRISAYLLIASLLLVLYIIYRYPLMEHVKQSLPWNPDYYEVANV